jgi:hypothetical protein
MSVVAGAGAGTLSGAYKYLAVYRFTDANGNGHTSRVYGPVSVTNAGGNDTNSVTVFPIGVTNMDTGNGSVPFVEVYRTLAGGTQYYLCATSQVGIGFSSTSSVQQITASGTTALAGITDVMSDATLASQAAMYRQPGTPNAAVDRYAAPATKCVIQHKDRVFCVDAVAPRVYYSSFFVDGECAWFNPVFSFFVHSGQGPITALASMGGRLLVFKRDAIFVVDGDGPGEAGPTGSEFSPPQELSARYGCIDHRSVVSTPDGVLFRSSRGIELLTSSLQLKWVGDVVATTVNDNPITTGACMDAFGRAHFTLAVSETANGSYNVAGVELVYDMTNGAWSLHKSTGAYSTYGKCRQSCASVVDDGVEKLVYGDSYIGVAMENYDSGLDYSSAYVPFVIETGWIRAAQQVRQRLSEVLFLAKKVTACNHALKISVAYDFVDSYTQVQVWEPNEINSLTIEELCLPITTPESLAIRLKIEDQTPANTVTYPVGTGRGCDVLGISCEIAPKQGAPKGNRGGLAYTQPFVAGVCEESGTTVGGETVYVMGKGLTGVTAVYFDNVAATSVSVVNDGRVSCVTPAGSAGTADVRVEAPGGSATGLAVFTYVSPTFPGIASLDLNRYFIAPYTTPTWSGSASAGISATKSLTDATNPATAGAALNGLTTARFDGVNDVMLDANTFSHSYQPNLYMMFLINPTTLDAPTSADNDPALYGDQYAYARVTITTSGVAVRILSAEGPAVTSAYVAAPLATWTLVRIKMDGKKVYIAKNSDAFDAGTTCSLPAALSGPARFGKSADSTNFFHGDIAAILRTGEDLDEATFLGIKAELNTVFGLSL